MNTASLLRDPCHRCMSWIWSWQKHPLPLKDILQNNWSIVFKGVRVMKVKGRLRNDSREEDVTAKRRNRCWAAPFHHKEIAGTSGRTWLVSEAHLITMCRCYFSDSAGCVVNIFENTFVARKTHSSTGERSSEQLNSHMLSEETSLSSSPTFLWVCDYPKIKISLRKWM